MAATVHLAGASSSYRSGSGMGFIQSAILVSGGVVSELNIWQGGASDGTNLVTDQKKLILKSPANDVRTIIQARINFRGDYLIRLTGDGSQAIVVLE